VKRQLQPIFIWEVWTGEGLRAERGVRLEQTTAGVTSRGGLFCLKRPSTTNFLSGVERGVSGSQGGGQQDSSRSIQGSNE